MQNFSYLMQWKHWGLKGGGKNVRFQQKIGHISNTVSNTAKVTINH